MRRQCERVGRRKAAPKYICFRMPKGFRPLGHPEADVFRGCFPAAHPLALPTHQPPPHGDDFKAGYQPAGYALAGWGSHPLDDSSEFWSTSEDLLSDRHCLVASENLIRPAIVDFLIFGCGPWDDDSMAPLGPSDPPWDGSIPPLAVG